MQASVIADTIKGAVAASTSWDGFSADPEWVATKKASEDAAGGSLTVPDGVTSVMLLPTDFSPVCERGGLAPVTGCNHHFLGCSGHRPE